MVGDISSGQQEAAPEQNTFLTELGSLLLDRQGRILSCGTPTEKIFGASHQQLMGRQVSALIGDLLPGACLPGDDASYIDHLCADGEWRRFAARDVGGHGVTVELKVSPMVTSHQEVFLLYVRRVEDNNASPVPGLAPQQGEFDEQRN